MPIDPFTAIFLASSATSAFGQIQAGRAERLASQLTAFRTETEGELNKAMALQRANARREEYNQATSANIAAFSINRDIGSDRSVEAFLNRQKEIVAQDLGRLDTQASFEVAKYKAAAATEIRRGKNAQRASLFSAVGTLGSSAYQYDQVRT
jgi:hypothetical protein